MFKHQPVDLGYENLVAKTTSKNRVYTTPDGHKYPSITTILSRLSRDGIAKWRARVGAKEANRISQFASKRGTAVHEVFERYINNEENYLVCPRNGKSPLHVRANFLEAKQHLDDRLGLVYAQEVPLYSDHLTVAGRVDLVGEWDGKPANIDFKTSGKRKPHNFCHSYFMQEAFYAIAWEERTKQPIKQLVTIIAGDQGLQIFIEDRDQWAPKLIETISDYYEEIANG